MADSTNDTNLTVKVTLNAHRPPRRRWPATSVKLGTAARCWRAMRCWTADITAGFANVQTGTLTDGTTYTITATVTDAAGNQSTALQQLHGDRGHHGAGRRRWRSPAIATDTGDAR